MPTLAQNPKRRYTAYHSHITWVAKQHGISVDECIDRMSKQVEDENDYVMLCVSVMEKHLIEKKGVHLFLPNLAFCEWLVGCVGDLENNHGKLLMELSKESEALICCLHFPTSARKVSCVFHIPEHGYYPDGTTAQDYGCLMMGFSRGQWNPDKASCSVLLNKYGNCSEWSMWYAKLIVGIGMYLACFPDAAIDGVPQDLQHPPFHKGLTAKTISVSEHVITERGSPAAHYRSGHFRVLTSERFTKKRFQVVFVRETFVGGKAKTVLEPEQVN